MANMFFYRIAKIGPVAKTDVFINCLTMENANKRVGLFSCQCLLGKQSFSGRKKGYLDDDDEDDDEWHCVL